MLITIGAFDGFHRGHEELLNICRCNADGDNWGVVSFHPHPFEFMNGTNHSIFTLTERELIRKIIGIPNMYILRFDDRLRNLKPEEFWKLIRDRFNVDGLVMGRDFHFGLNRSGNAESLAMLAEHDGIRRIIIADLFNKGTYSSSKVRREIISGNVTGAYDILGYPYFMISSIIHGNQRGRTMKIPTANLNLTKHHIIPKSGVYSSAVLVNNEYHCGALSIGNNPTFNDVNELRAEVHILDFNDDVYDSILPVFFLGRLRDIKTFGSKDELIMQIERDIKECRRIYDEVMMKEDMKIFFDTVKRVYDSRKNFIPEIINLVV